MYKRIIFVPGEQKTHEDRCLATAQILIKKLKVKPLFLSNHQIGTFPFIEPDDNILKQLIGLNPEVVVFDCHSTSQETVMELQKLHIKVINQCYKDISRHVCDYKISPVRTENYIKPTYYEGSEYAILDKEFYKNGIKIKRRATKIVMRTNSRKALTKIRKALKGLNTKLTAIKFMNADIIRQHDLAIMPLDYTLYQSLATGIPTMILSHSLEEEARAVYFENTNAVVHLGFYKKVSIKDIHQILKKIIHAQARRKNMSYRAKGLVNRDAWDNVYKIYKKALEG